MKFKLLNLLFVACFLIAPGFLQATPTLSKVIDVAGRQRMLSQKMLKEILYVYNDIHPEENLKKLKATSNLFEESMLHLIFGYEEDDIPQVVNADTFWKLDDVVQIWDSVDFLVETVIEKEGAPRAYLPFLDVNGMSLLKGAHSAVQAMVKAVGSDGKMSAAKSHTINIAGRQRMLSQRMTKEFLFLQANYHVEDYKKKLKDSVNLFDITLSHLRVGNVHENVIAPPTEKIKNQLEHVAGLWAKMEPSLRKSIKGKKLSENEINLVVNTEGALLREMNKAVRMY